MVEPRPSRLELPRREAFLELQRASSPEENAAVVAAIRARSVRSGLFGKLELHQKGRTLGLRGSAGITLDRAPSILETAKFPGHASFELDLDNVRSWSGITQRNRKLVGLWTLAGDLRRATDLETEAFGDRLLEWHAFIVALQRERQIVELCKRRVPIEETHLVVGLWTAVGRWAVVDVSPHSALHDDLEPRWQ